MNNRTVIGGLACAGSGCITIVLVCAYMIMRFVYHSPIRQFNVYNKVGNDFYQKGQYQIASDEYGKMIKLMPSKNDGYFLRAMAEYKLKQYQQGVEDNTHVIKMTAPSSVHTAAFFNRGMDYMELGEYRKAINDFDRTLMRNPSDRNASDGRNWCYRNLGDPVTGASIPRSVPDKHGAEYTRLLTTGSGQLASKNYAGAEKTYKSAIKLISFDPTAWSNMAWAQYLEGNVSQAIETNKVAMKIDPNLSFMRFNMGLYYAVSGNEDDAKLNYSAGLKYSTAADIKGATQDIADARKKYASAGGILSIAEILLKSQATNTGSAQ